MEEKNVEVSAYSEVQAGMKQASEALRKVAMSDVKQCPGAMYALQNVEVKLREAFMWTMESLMQFEHMQNLAKNPGDPKFELVK